MTPEQKQRVLWTLNREHQELQQLDTGQYPEWVRMCRPASPENALLSLDDRHIYADWCLKDILVSLIPTLPKEVREQVQACLALREQMWSEQYVKTYFEQKHAGTTVKAL